MGVCMYVCMYVHRHVCMQACMYVGMYVCMYVCMHPCKHARLHVMYVCMHVSKSDPDKANSANSIKLFWIHEKLSAYLHRRGSTEYPRKTSMEDMSRGTHGKEDQ